MSSGPSTVELLVRLVFSLGLIVGLLMIAAKFAKKNGGALKLPGFGKKDTAIKVLERHSLTKTASIAVVQIGDRTMVVGISEHGITRLADGPELDADDDRTTDAAAASADIDLLDDDAIVDLAGADIATALALRSGSSLPATPATTAASIDTPEAKRTLPLGSATATLAAPARPPRMSFIEALRELTVRKA
jgi:flagellar biogenesis protein FliO